MTLTFKLLLNDGKLLILFRTAEGVSIQLWEEDRLISEAIEKPNEFRRMAELLS